MRKVSLLFLTLFLNANLYADENDKLGMAEPEVVKSYYEYCIEIKTEEDELEQHILGCVNTQLEESGFDIFKSYRDIIAHIKTGDE